MRWSRCAAGETPRGMTSVTSRGRWSHWLRVHAAAVSTLALATGVLPARVAMAAPAPATSPTPPTAAAPQSAPAAQVDGTGMPFIDDRHFDAARSREVPTLDRRVRQWDNPDGTHTVRIGSGPIAGEDAKGVRGPLDLTLAAGADGRLRPHRTAVRVALASTSGPGMA